VAQLEGFRVLVVGASAGIGRAIGVRAAQAGARVVLAARRVERLQSAVEEAGASAVAITCDVQDDEQCRATVTFAVEQLGGLDAVVYSAGASPLTRSLEASGALWRTVIGTNVLGAAMVAQAAIPHLRASQGRLVFLGSSSVGRPYPGLVPYATSKAALHEMARGLRGEYPWLRLTTFVVGPTISEFSHDWDPDLTGEMFARWAVEGYPAGAALAVEDTADQVLAVLESPIRIEEIAVMPDAPAGAQSPLPPDQR
jgi:NADP-dependent 3-hydroxy acid dehydrogenase YdfG